MTRREDMKPESFIHRVHPSTVRSTLRNRGTDLRNLLLPVGKSARPIQTCSAFLRVSLVKLCFDFQHTHPFVLFHGARFVYA